MNARRFVIGLVLVMLTRSAGAQSTLGSIVGTAQDPSALALPGATITLRSADENTMQSTAVFRRDSAVSDNLVGFEPDFRWRSVC